MKPRPIGSLLALLLLVPALGAALAPLVYGRVVPLLHRIWPGYAPFDAPDFPRVLNRCVLVAALILLVPALRRSGLLPELRAGLRMDRPRAKALSMAVALGLASMGLAYVIGWLLGGYRLADECASAGRLLNRMGIFLIGAVFIGIFEEAFFRGFVFGALRQRFGFAAAASIASVFFSAVHFLQPAPAEHATTGWNAGFSLLSGLFGGFDLARDGAFAVTLFVMGLVLCRHYERDGHLWCIAGLHAGWVWAMQLGAFVMDRNWALMRDVLGPSEYIAQGPLAVPIVLAFLLATFRNKRSSPGG